MIAYFKSQHISTVLVFILLFICLKIPFLISGTLVPIAKVNQLWGTSGLLLQDYLFINRLLAMSSLLIQAFWFNFLFHKASYHESNSMIPALYYALISSLLPEFNVFSYYHIIAFILLALFHSFLLITERDNTKIYCFNVGVLVGLLVLIYPNFLYFVPFFFVIIFVISNASVSEYVLMIFGVTFPFYLAISLSYILNNPINLSVLHVFNFNFFTLTNNTLTLIVLAVTALYLLFSFVSMRGIMFSSGIKRRKNVNLLILQLLGMTTVVLLNDKADETSGVLLFIPVSIFLTLFMLRIRKKRLGEILNVIFVLVTIVTNVIRLFE